CWHGPGLLFLPAAVTGQVVLEQSSRELGMQEGDGVILKCHVSGEITSSYYLFWYQQGPHGTLDWIYWPGVAYGEGFQGHFKESVCQSQKGCDL
ncbi:HV741 protein, partial [Crotophaga sulcirostris]|nr:HV741 protein [Crotophaga sulcirostris]